MEKTIDNYMALPYTIELRQVPEEGWFVRVNELRGCMSQGDTAAEALAMIREAMALWLDVALEEGIPIPEPRPDEEYSGMAIDWTHCAGYAQHAQMYAQLAFN